MSSPVTIKSIARDLGISHMTVSRALAGHHNVRKTTRDAILARAAELGYVKSAAASAMRGEKTSIVGVLLPNISNEFYAGFANALAAHCTDHGLSPIIHLTDDDPARENAALRSLRALQSGAVVMVPTPGPFRGAGDLDFDRVVQLIRRRPDDAPVCEVTIEDREALIKAVSHLAATGRRRIAFIGAIPKLSSGRERLAAYRAGLDQAGLPYDETLIHLGAPSIDLGRRGVAALLAGAAPDAIICGGFEISNGALEMVLLREMSLPCDLAFIGYGDPPFYRWVAGGISTISLPVDAMAMATIRLLTDSDAESGRKLSKPAQLTLRGSA